MADEKLYESTAVWDQELQTGQRNLIQAICDHWPKGIRTVLDVGCGDGKITHALAERTNASFHGFDGSREALSRVRLPSTHGDVGALPFGNDAFDVVLTTDVFEHLPDQVEQTAWAELFRVARDWVFFVVPFQEEMLDASAICANCGEQYHVNWHYRSYDFPGLSNRTPPGWRLVRAVLSGERWSPMLPPETLYRRLELKEWSGWSEAVCPACGEPGKAAAEPTMFAADAARALGQCTYELVSKRRFVRSHSEILVIFCRADMLHENDEPPACETELISAAQWASCLGVADSLDPYPQTARMVSAVGGGYITQFPVYTGSLPLLSFVGCKTEVISVTVEDGRGVVFSGNVDLSKGVTSSIALPRGVCTGYYGLIVRLPSIEPLESITLAGEAPVVQYVLSFKDGMNYCDVPGTVLRVQAKNPLWIDYESLVSPPSNLDQIDAPTVPPARKCDHFVEHVKQRLINILREDKENLEQQLHLSNHEASQMQFAYERSKLELTQLKERIEVRLGSWMRRAFRNHRKSDER